jgi:hypothetical protein
MSQSLGSPNGSLRDRIILAIREQGLDHDGPSPHSWRCEHPDRYPGYCDCVEDMADAVLEVIHGRENSPTDDEVFLAGASALKELES